MQHLLQNTKSQSRQATETSFTKTAIRHNLRPKCFISIVFSFAVSASAITTGNWDFGAYTGHIDWGKVSNPTEPEDPETSIGDAISAVVITYDYNGGRVWKNWTSAKSETVEETFNPAKDAYHTVVSTVPTRFGYTFGGWEYDGEVYQAGDQILIEGAFTLTAVWTKK